MVGIRRTALLLAVLALASCASFQQSRDRDAARQVTDLINTGKADRLAAMSAAPFLVDGEIVLLPEDVASFWNGIVTAGYRVEDAVVGQAETVGVDSYRQFADTMEARTFFIKYVKNGARVLRMDTVTGGSILIIVAPVCFSWRIIGWKGPF